MIVLTLPRVCPGSFFALRTVYLVVACVLSVFVVEPALDEGGKPQVPEAEFDSLIVRYVLGVHQSAMLQQC